jgi:hypothetical protein
LEGAWLPALSLAGLRKAANERSGTAPNPVQMPTDIVFLVILWRFQCKLSLRDLAEMFLLRSIVFGHEAVRAGEAGLARPLPRSSAKIAGRKMSSRPSRDLCGEMDCPRKKATLKPDAL